jgi:hypothetical protein
MRAAAKMTSATSLPLESSVSPPLTSQSLKRLQKGTAIFRSDLIFHGHQHWPSIGIDIAGKDRSRAHVTRRVGTIEIALQWEALTFQL